MRKVLMMSALVTGLGATVAVAQPTTEEIVAMYPGATRIEIDRGFRYTEVEVYMDGKEIDLWPPIHKLHGSCAYSGVPRLKNLCHRIETELKAGASIRDIEPELFELVDEMNNVVKASKRYRP